LLEQVPGYCGYESFWFEHEYQKILVPKIAYNFVNETGSTALFLAQTMIFKLKEEICLKSGMTTSDLSFVCF
jgi:hypothetical protein